MTEPLVGGGRPGLRPPPGIVVAIYGTDGSGKGTLIAGLRARLRDAFAGVVHVHLFDVQDPENPAAPFLEPHGRTARSPLTSAVKVFWYLARAWLGRRPLIRRARRRGYLVLVDRDVPDARIDPARYRIGAPNWLLSLLERAAPRPDVGLLLDAPADVIAGRTDEVSLERLATLCEAYRDFAARSPWMRSLDASRTPDEVLDAAAAAVLASAETVPGRASAPVASPPTVEGGGAR